MPDKDIAVQESTGQPPAQGAVIDSSPLGVHAYTQPLATAGKKTLKYRVFQAYPELEAMVKAERSISKTSNELRRCLECILLYRATSSGGTLSRADTALLALVSKVQAEHPRRGPKRKQQDPDLAALAHARRGGGKKEGGLLKG